VLRGDIALRIACFAGGAIAGANQSGNAGITGRERAGRHAGAAACRRADASGRQRAGNNTGAADRGRAGTARA
jgi:hypothetical protein